MVIDDFVPVDGLIIQANDLEADESSITGPYFYFYEHINLHVKKSVFFIEEPDIIKRSENEGIALLSGI